MDWITGMTSDLLRICHYFHGGGVGHVCGVEAERPVKTSGQSRVKHNAS